MLQLRHYIYNRRTLPSLAPVDVNHGEPRVGAEGVRPHREDGAVRGPQPGHLQQGSSGQLGQEC